MAPSSETSWPEPSWHGADPDLPDFRDKKHELYRHLHAVAPVSLSPRGSWRLTRYEDAQRLLKQTKAGVRPSDGTGGTVDHFMLGKDGVDHARLRRLVARYFTPRAMGNLRQRMAEVARELLDEVDGDSTIDLVAALSLPLPSRMICEMLGVPQSDREDVIQWTGDLTYVLMGDAASPEQRTRAQQARAKMGAYITRLIEQRRDSLNDDLISVLIRKEEDGDQLSPEELVWQVMGLILAGFETTTALITNVVRLLVLNPDQLALVRSDRSLIAGAVEEALRLEPPVTAVRRFLHEPAEFGGFDLEVDTPVVAVLVAANRDPEVFDNPDAFDVTRTPNRHLAFGMGPHVCLGLQMARMEAAVALEELLERTTSMELVTRRREWAVSLMHTLATLQVKVSWT